MQNKTMVIKTKTSKLIKQNLKEFTFKNRQILACDSFFGEFVPFGYCPGKERKSKNILSIQ